MLKLSIAERLKQAIPPLFNAFLPETCHLCSGSSTSKLCKRCYESLPKNNKASCSICDLPLLLSDSILCHDCMQKPPSFDLALCAWRYEAPINQLITSIKEKHGHFWIPTLSQPLLRKIQRCYIHTGRSHQPPHSQTARESSMGPLYSLPDILVPIPIHWTSKVVRGYNQSQLIAQHLASQVKRPVKSVLQKRIRTPAQKGLTRLQRQRNLQSGFVCKQTVEGKHIALIDDVMTTGATAEAASQLLRQHGAMRVDIWALARTPKA